MMDVQDDRFNAVVPLPEDIRWHTVVDAVWGHAHQQSDKLALVASSLDGTVKRLTYEELAGRAEDVAAGLRERGIGKGDHVGIALGNSAAYEFVLTELACLRLGAVAVLINPGSKRDELLHALSLTECLVVISGRECAADITALRTQLPGLGPVFEVTSPGEPCALRWDRLLTSKRPLEKTYPCPQASDDAFVIMTSGTTGRPKAVTLTHANSVAGGAAMVRAWGIRADDIVQTPIPLTTSAGCFVTRMGPFYAGTTLVIDPPFDSEITFARVRTEGTTVLLVVPAIIIFMTEQFDPARHSLETVRLFCFGSAPITVATLDRARARFPWIRLGQIYGMTESSTVGAYLSPEVFNEHLGSIGRPVLCEMRITDEADRDVKAGEAGQILIRGPSVMRGYHRDPEATAEALAGGWLHTGDLGYVDTEGYFYHVDRVKDMIVRGGYKVGSIEVENVLIQHPAVQEAAVLAVPHPKLGEDVFAFVVLRGQTTVDMQVLVEYCREKLAHYKVPRRIACISALPRNLAGKIDKLGLRKDAQDILGNTAA
jgi:acyl-CoA synthetase (AMP-forming)/AMP-acid ligase II